MELNMKKVSNKTYRFLWKDPLNPMSIEIVIPDLTSLDYIVWGDWGPMYTFSLNELHKIRIQYNGVFFDNCQKQLRIESPVFAKERENYPFYLIVEDPKRDLRFYLYLTQRYELGKVQVLRTIDDVMLFERDRSLYNLRQVI